jgi:hypothetical protein
MGDALSWQDASVVVRPQLAIAVYQNDAGEIVVRQEAAPYESEDIWIVIARHNALAVVYAILDELGGGYEIIRRSGAGYEDVPHPECPVVDEPVPEPELDSAAANDSADKPLPAKLAPLTAAERARRYRENKKQRDAERDDRHDDVTQPRLLEAAE